MFCESRCCIAELVWAYISKITFTFFWHRKCINWRCKQIRFFFRLPFYRFSHYFFRSDIRDRSILRLFETDSLALCLPLSLPSTFPVPSQLMTASPSHFTSSHTSTLPICSSKFDADLSYFSEPEYDSEYQHQHVHKAKVNSHVANFLFGHLIVGDCTIAVLFQCYFIYLFDLYSRLERSLPLAPLHFTDTTATVVRGVRRR